MAIGSVMTFLMNKILITYHSARETAATAFGIYFKLNSFVFMPVFGLNNGVIPIIAFNYGAQQRRRMIETIKRSTVYASCVMVLGMVIFQLLPGTQGIYGLLIGFVIASKANLLGAGSAISPEAGMSLFLAALPIAFGGLLSAIAQGKVAASGIAMVGKRPSEAGKAIIFTVMVETYAVLSLLFSFLLVNGVQV